VQWVLTGQVSLSRALLVSLCTFLAPPNDLTSRLDRKEGGCMWVCHFGILQLTACSFAVGMSVGGGGLIVLIMLIVMLIVLVVLVVLWLLLL
jgi:hypothetical protein